MDHMLAWSARAQLLLLLLAGPWACLHVSAERSLLHGGGAEYAHDPKTQGLKLVVDIPPTKIDKTPIKGTKLVRHNGGAEWAHDPATGGLKQVVDIQPTYTVVPDDTSSTASSTASGTSSGSTAKLGAVKTTPAAVTPAAAGTPANTTGSPAAAAGPIDVDARMRGEWRRLSVQCPQRTYKTCAGVDRSTWTDTGRTLVSNFTFNGLAAWSTFTLTTFDSKGSRRTRGGDSWLIFLRDAAQKMRIPGRHFDEGDGTYTVAAFFLRAGNYSLHAWHYYSDCHGLQEPVKSMDDYAKELKKPDHCYIGKRLVKIGAFQITKPTTLPTCLKKGCVQQEVAPHKDGSGHVWRMETYYYRKNTVMFSYQRCCKPRLPKPQVPTKRVLFYGDSTVRNSWEIITLAARRPCNATWEPRMISEHLTPARCPAVASLAQMDPDFDAITKRCTGGYPWTTVPVGTDTHDVQQYDPHALLFNMSDFKYNDTFARNHTPPVALPVPREFSFVYVDGWGPRPIFIFLERTLAYVQPGDVLIINMGPHYTRTMSFDKWQVHMDTLAEALKKKMAEVQGLTVVWRTSFMTKEHVFRNYKHADGYIPQAHFNSDARRLMFDSYAEHALLPLGVHIWDVFGASVIGDFKPHDMMHTDGASIWAQNADMMDIFACRN